VEDPHIPKARYLGKPFKYLCISGEALTTREVLIETALL
jgi:hypothetical protein